MDHPHAAEILNELGDASRRRILVCLLDGPKNVSEIVAATGFKQPNVSNHLARLREKNLVQAVKVGRTVSYSLADFNVQQVVQQAVAPLEVVRSEQDWNAAIEEFANLAIQGDKMGCMQLLKSVFTSDVTLEHLYADFLTPVMYLVGHWYQEGRIDVGDEHFASEIMLRVMARAALMRAPARMLGKSVVMGCSPDNYHGIGLRMVGDCLRVRGWDVLFLGANVPIDAFVASVKRHEPALVLISCAGPNSHDGVELVRAIAQMRPDRDALKIGVGGAHIIIDSAPYLAAGADFAATTLNEFLAVIGPEVEESVPTTESA